ncbi:PIR Superfamily Protein [Plasmodium ovale curtisi]|uniref:PIR Superfamily Protein n=1 Tax=Plasmodium ovale curtisi TaxID=864141 RepID=A0A1A8WNR3_PLAOA|nr:PIR Superfamily Protein [Plasmodium ovale curtisi]SBS99866.1 PIR Superfamily Protein [Plasmodium ovale curtisi]
MTKSISEKDLPSAKFEELKDKIQYKTLEGYVNNATTDDNINSWIQSFKSNVEIYLSDSSKRFSFSDVKHCKDFNYLINTTISKINSLSNSFWNKASWSNEIKQWRDGYFTRNIHFKCNEHDKYKDSRLKDLYDFCDDNIFIKNKLSEIEKSGQCEGIITNMLNRISKLKPEKEKFLGKIQHTEISDVPCDPNILDSTYPSFTCKPTPKFSSETGEHGTISSHTDSRESAEILLIEQLPSFGDTNDDRHESLAVTGEGEPSTDSSSNTIGLISLPIFGVLALSFILYRYTPLGLKFHASFRNNEDISINQDYKSTNEMLSNISNSNDMYSQGMQYNVSYQTL